MSDRSPEVAATGLAFFRAIGLRGLASVEFKRDARDGELKLIECNHRLSGSTEFLRVCGIDQVKLVYERARGRSPRPVPTYRSGVHMWHPIEDVRAFAAYRRRGELDTRSWLRSLAHRQHFSLLRWDDPQPSLASNAQRVRRAMRKMTPVRVRS